MEMTIEEEKASLVIFEVLFILKYIEPKNQASQFHVR